MAKYRITGPDGAKYDINAPDDASQEQILEYAKTQFGGNEQSNNIIPDKRALVNQPAAIPTMEQSMREELASRSPLERFNAGIGTPLDLSAIGLKGLVKGLNPEEKQRAQMDHVISTTPEGLAGAIGGNMAMMYAPSTAISGLASQVPSIPGRIAANVGGHALLGGGYGALSNPDSRLQGGLMGAGGGAVGGALGEVLSGVFRPAAGSAAAGLAKEGVPLTPGQSVGGVAKRVEDAMRTMTPGIAKRQGEAVESWSRNLVNESLPPGSVKIPAGENIIKGGADAFDHAYDSAYAGMGAIKPDASLNMSLTGIAAKFAPKLTASDRQTMLEEIGRIKGEFAGGGLEGRAVKDLIGSYRSLAQKAFSGTAEKPANARLAEAYEATADALRDLTARRAPEAAQQIRNIDRSYGDFLAMQRAAGKAGAEDGTFSPGNLKQAIKDLDKSKDKRAFARGTTKADLRDQAETGIDVLGPTIPQVGPGTAEKLMAPMMIANPITTLPYLGAAAAYTKPLQSLLLGRSALNRAGRPLTLLPLSSSTLLGQ